MCTKICKGCLIEKELTQFYNNSENKDGKFGKCIDCVKERKKSVEAKELAKITYDKRKHRYKDRPYRKYRKLSNESKIKKSIRMSEYRLKNLEKLSEYNRLYKITHKKPTSLSQKFRKILKQFIKRHCDKTDKTYYMLGYSFNQFKQRIEMNFKKGMSWENHGEWHIDHKKPISKFEKNTSVKIVNALSNLQPLWAIDNLRKSNNF